MSDQPNVREKLKLVADWLGDQDEQLSFGLRSTDDGITLYDAAMSSMNNLGEMADEWTEAERIRLLGYDPMASDKQPMVQKVRSRVDVVALINTQLEGLTTASRSKTASHYGKVELRELLDFVYGGPPRSKREKL